ncbi:MAG: PIG-L family deacetylase [Candidatus Aenigmarchaeota archaeon]|nr:PIG-L family deacetylase [Candidatus Aenigmarchaeota archaeon]
MKILIFQPHNNNAIIGMGGTILRLKEKGAKISYVYMTDGRHGTELIPEEKIIEYRKQEGQDEREFVGISDYHQFNLEDGTLSKLDDEQKDKTKQKIREIIETENPDVVFMPSRTNMHEDYMGCHDIVKDILLQIKPNVLIGKYSVWLMPDFYEKRKDTPKNVFLIDVTQQTEKKLQAIKKHISQEREADFAGIANLISEYYAKIYGTYRKDRTIFRAEVLGFDGTDEDIENISKLLDAIDITKITHGREDAEITD